MASERWRARSWLNGSTCIRDIIEAQLAHSKSGPLGAAYDRAEFVTQRRAMMNEWADYLDGLRDRHQAQGREDDVRD